MREFDCVIGIMLACTSCAKLRDIAYGHDAADFNNQEANPSFEGDTTHRGEGIVDDYVRATRMRDCALCLLSCALHILSTESPLVVSVRSVSHVNLQCL